MEKPRSYSSRYPGVLWSIISLVIEAVIEGEDD